MDAIITLIYARIVGWSARYGTRWGLSLAGIMMLAAPMRADEMFPIPPQIEKNVEFWIKVYGQYASNLVVIHDKSDLSIVYKVVNLDDYYPDSLDIHAKWYAVEALKDDYRRILEKLARLRKPVNLDSLTIEERNVYILWSRHNEPNKFNAAIAGLRGQLGLRDKFAESIRRSGYYKNDIDRIFASYNLPLELTHLPHVESLFNYKSYSKVGAAGIWQFMTYTGELFMTIDAGLDERLDPIKATESAAKLLRNNYNELQSWPLAITAYNHGVNGMMNAKQTLRTDDFGIIYDNYKSSMFGFASKNFYAEFLAAWHVAENYRTYFGEIELYPQKRYQSIELTSPLYLKELAALYELPVDTLTAYNLAFKWLIIRNELPVPKGYHLRLPYREGFDPREALVQNTKPAARKKAKKPVETAWNYPNAKTDSLQVKANTSSDELEDYILRKLRQAPVETIDESGAPGDFQQTPANLHPKP